MIIIIIIIIIIIFIIITIRNQLWNPTFIINSSDPFASHTNYPRPFYIFTVALHRVTVRPINAKLLAQLFYF